MSYHAIFQRAPNGDGRMQYRCVKVFEGSGSMDVYPATEFSPAELCVNVTRRPPQGKFCQRPHRYI